MVLLQPQPGALSHGEMMGRVMQRIIKNVAADQSGHNRRTKPAKNEREQDVKEKRERNAHYRRHDQPAGVIGIIMMNAMHNKVQHLARPALRFVMENESMNDVFQERPN